MEIIGYSTALLIGLSLGLTGSGGSILTVPILVCLLRLSPVMATTSMVGGFKFYRQGLVNWPFLLNFSFIGSAFAPKIDSDKLKRGFGWFVLAMGGYILVKELFL
jgi:hypothetical protein